MNNKDAFINGEGNAWFERNLHALNINNDMPIKMIELYGLKPKKVLEIGCSNGYRLDFLQQIFKCACVGVEPSQEAIDYGKERYQNIRFINGKSNKIPLDEKFDLIIVNFVLHWVDREEIAATINEIDRLLENGGCLIIGDFYPNYPMANKYHHLPDANVLTYKQDYPSIFTSLGYIHAAHLSKPHQKDAPLGVVLESNERVSVSLLVKK